MRKLYTWLAAGLLLTTAAMADVTVTFVNALPTRTMVEDLLLDFTVDGSGSVTLDASTSSTNTAVIAAVNSWDGAAGTVSYSDAFGTDFSISMDSTGDEIRLTSQGDLGGLGVQGNNQNKIDDPGVEELYAAPIFDGYVAALNMKSMKWTGASGGVPQEQKARIDTATGVYNYPVDMTQDGSWDLTGSNVYVNAGESIAFGNDHSITNKESGYVLAGFTFDLKVFEGDSTLTTTLTEDPGDRADAAILFTVNADGTETSVDGGNAGLPTEGLLAGSTGSFGFEWDAVDLFDSNVFTGRVGNGWQYNGGQDALGPNTISDSGINMVSSEAVIMTITNNSLSLPAGKHLRLNNVKIRSAKGNHVFAHYDASEDTYTELTGTGDGQYAPISTGASIAGSLQTLNVIVEEGDKIAMYVTGNGQVRLFGFEFTTVEIVSDTEVPENVTATALDTAVLLDWDDDDTGVPLETYTVYRSLTAGVTTNDTLTNVTVSSYLDLDVINGTNYYYAVTSTGTNGNESALSAEVSATPAAASTNIVRFQWLDASDASSVTTNASGELTLWADKENSYDAEQGSTGPGLPELPVLWPSASLSGSGLAGMDVRTNRSNILALNMEDTTALLDFSGDAALNNGFSVLVAFKADYIFDDPDEGNIRNVVLGTAENAAGANGFGMRYDRGDMQVFMNSDGINTLLEKDDVGDLDVKAGDTIVFAFTYKAADGAMKFWDSKNDSVATADTAPYGKFTNDDLDLAGSGNGGQYMDGLIGEVQIFSSMMSEAELISRGQALAAKWGAEAASSFEVWANSWGAGAPEEDDDNDGVLNLAEYALNGNPTNGLVDTISDIVTDGGLGHVYAVRNDDETLTYTVLTTDDLVGGSWTNSGLVVPIATNAPGGVYDYVTNSVPTTDPELFIRVQIGN